MPWDYTFLHRRVPLVSTKKVKEVNRARLREEPENASCTALEDRQDSAEPFLRFLEVLPSVNPALLP